ncbi:hypothetical protein MJO28_015532 [Puccinia striiformis f. sp. tritici]|uniref:Uncharacterized protein n=2 Tax=Puccinia striiformis TaxID=27350 RepID=A0A2S4VB90_9BASI|nr:hypothetical protein Pst134EA_029450 [Puccinia striiformis f. sp. tritici]KAH9447411.1 hypothetical protein Pst134EA_029450 [Puccinia striiformis f. sp. tritici]KAI7936633.1 hypothetical protein MJO28_015532 [Puccinia striiformis f. sp. tritici]POW06809.1 hypothetical protein PSHT_10205 [Puccinia striiformis]
MDNSSYGAYGRIQLFLADLNLVLGCLPSPTDNRPTLAFNQIGISQNPHLSAYHQQPSWNRPTNRSRAWKEKYSKTRSDRSHKPCHTQRSVPSSTLQELTSNPKAYSARLPLSQRPAPIRGHPERHTRRQISQSARHVQTNDHPQHLQDSYVRDPRLYVKTPRANFQPEYLDHGGLSAADHPSKTADKHSFLERPGEKMDEDQYREAHSDEETDETLDQEESEWDDRSDLDIMADSDHFNPFQTPVAPIELEPNPVSSDCNGSVNDIIFDPALTTGPVSHEEAVFQPILLPMMPSNPEPAAPSKNPCSVAPLSTLPSPLPGPHTTISTEVIDPILTYLDGNIGSISLDDNFTLRQPNHSLDSPPDNMLESSDHYVFDNHNLYNNNDDSDLDDSTSNNHHNYNGGQAEDLNDQRAEYKAGHDLYDVGEDNFDGRVDNPDGGEDNFDGRGNNPDGGDDYHDGGGDYYENGEENTDGGEDYYDGGEDYYDGGEDYYDGGEDYHEDGEENNDGEAYDY